MYQRCRLFIIIGIFFLGIKVYSPLSWGESHKTQLKKEAVLKIGAIASLSGAASRQGKNWLRCAKIAVEEINKKAEKVRIKLISEDDQTNAGKAVSAFLKLKDFNGVRAIIGGTWDFLAEPLYPLARRYKIFFLTPTNPVEIMSKDALNNPYVFTNGLSLAAT
ncbi:MAG: amino acid ABC transporter substrate-binding protein, partial [Candidatus Dadabacteria bacterium]